ncbi:MAG: hypothetical protein U1E05_24220 [Patescibacteria group bacterium]|nr:hypothetical protein [Patescibacteria group bacterium]
MAPRFACSTCSATIAFRLFDYIPGHPDEPVERLFASAIERGGYRYASLPWLRAMKMAADRSKDRLDLENLPESPHP